MKIKEKIVPFLIVVFGLILLAYPFISNYIFEKSASSKVHSYEQKADTMDQEKINRMFQEAKKYNDDLRKSLVQLTDPFKLKQKSGENLEYQKILNIDGSGIMGYVKIPCISVELPVYHGTSAEVLEHGVGHLAASSFPIGGKSTHSVITGHTGLSSARLFTDLTQMKKGDLFYIHVLDRILAYKVDQISIVKPEDTEKLQIVKGKDYVTLVTCTPYGVNDHRLLIRGIRTRYEKKQEARESGNRGSQWMSVYKRAVLIGLAIVFVIVLTAKMIKRMKSRTMKGDRE